MRVFPWRQRKYCLFSVMILTLACLVPGIVCPRDQEKRRTNSFSGSVRRNSTSDRGASASAASILKLPLNSECANPEECETDLCERGRCICMENLASTCQLNENCCSGYCDTSSKCVSKEFYQRQQRAAEELDRKRDQVDSRAPPRLYSSPWGIEWRKHNGNYISINKPCWKHFGAIPCDKGLFCMKWTSKLASPGMCFTKGDPQPEHSLCLRNSQCLSDRCRLFTCSCVPDGEVCLMDAVCCSGKCHAQFCISESYALKLIKDSNDKYNQAHHYVEKDGVFSNAVAEAESKAKTKMREKAKGTVRSEQAFAKLEDLDISGLTVSDQKKYMAFVKKKEEREEAARGESTPDRPIKNKSNFERTGAIPKGKTKASDQSRI